MWIARPDSSITNLLITDEFGWGSHSACGETSNACMTANVHNGAPTYGMAQSICNRDRTAGLTDPGADSQSIHAIWLDIQKFQSGLLPHCKLYPFMEWYSTDQLATVSRSMLGANAGLLIEIGRAYKLPFMEQGVNYHFCFLGAYDANHASGKHFYLLNPDRVPRPSGNASHQYGGDWVSIQDICNAGLCGMIRVFCP
jgi:hypothetical protein